MAMQPAQLVCSAMLLVLVVLAWLPMLAMLDVLATLI